MPLLLYIAAADYAASDDFSPFYAADVIDAVFAAASAEIHPHH